jgi:hypothetical protein
VCGGRSRESPIPEARSRCISPAISSTTLRDVPRRELIAGIDAAIASVERTFPEVGDGTLDAAYPELIAKRSVPSSYFLVHLASHLAYHLGQLDYHRRAVTGDSKAVDAISVRELPEV